MQQRVFSVLHKSALDSFAQVKIYAKYTQNAHILVDIHPPPPPPKKKKKKNIKKKKKKKKKEKKKKI